MWKYAQSEKYFKCQITLEGKIVLTFWRLSCTSSSIIKVKIIEVCQFIMLCISFNFYKIGACFFLLLYFYDSMNHKHLLQMCINAMLCIKLFSCFKTILSFINNNLWSIITRNPSRTIRITKMSEAQNITKNAI